MILDYFNYSNWSEAELDFYARKNGWIYDRTHGIVHRTFYDKINKLIVAKGLNITPIEQNLVKV